MTAWINGAAWHGVLFVAAVIAVLGGVIWLLVRMFLRDEEPLQDAGEFDRDLDDYEDDDETLLDMRAADLGRVYAGGPAAAEVGADAPGARAPGLSHVDGRPVAGADWRASMIVQLAPAALAAENLPGPVRSSAISGGHDTAPVLGRAGEIHYMDGWLGRDGDGSPLTFLRVRREQERMMARFEAEQAEWCASVGVVHVPVWRAAA